MHGALATHGKPPCVAGKPGELRGECAFEAATHGRCETSDLKQDTRRVEEGVRVHAVLCDPVLKAGDGVPAGPADEDSLPVFLESEAVLDVPGGFMDKGLQTPEEGRRMCRFHAVRDTPRNPECKEAL